MVTPLIGMSINRQLITYRYFFTKKKKKKNGQNIHRIFKEIRITQSHTRCWILFLAVKDHLNFTRCFLVLSVLKPN